MRWLPLLLFSLCFVRLTQEAQTGVITGRVVTEDGSGLPGVTVSLMPVAADRRTISSGPQTRILTDVDGNFKFTGLAPRVYSVSASSAKGYVRGPVPVSERQDSGWLRIGANVTITMIKGGAITGRVTNAMGEPMIAVQVNAAMAPGAEGNTDHGVSGRSGFTDDRGIYRIYGLSPGTYFVFTRNDFYFPSPYHGDASTYYPSSTRDTAAEVTVTSGGEASGVDIRYRGDRGHAVSGSISYSGEPASPYLRSLVALTNTVTGVRSDANFFPRVGGGTGFAIYGVPDGEYEITGRWLLSSNEEVIASAPRRVVVKGADVGGIELKKLPLGIIAGKFVLEATPGVCESKRKWSLEEALLAIRPGPKPEGASPARSQMVINGLTEKGEFTIYDLAADLFFLEPRLPNENWYVKAITAPASTSASANTSGAASRGARSTDISRDGITLKAGEKITGLVATIADGAAGLSGKAIPAVEGSRLPARLRIHLIPAEARAADEVLRYAEACARSDGSFLLSNLAPGKYWMMARAAPDDETSDLPVTPVAWDPTERAKLRREALTAKNEVELRPCGRVKDYILRFDR